MRKTEFYGRKAIVIKKGHAHQGRTGKCLGAEKTAFGWAMKFRDDITGKEFHVYDGKDINWIK